MSLILVCPYCGQKLCKAEEGSKVVMQCPKCKEELNLIVSNEKISVAKVEAQRPQKKAI